MNGVDSMRLDERVDIEFSEVCDVLYEYFRDSNDEYNYRITNNTYAGEVEVKYLRSIPPTGSSWRPMLGEHSIELRPIFIHDDKWVSIGITRIEEQKVNGRIKGAYPHKKCYLFSPQSFPSLNLAIDRILDQFPDINPSRLSQWSGYGVIRLDSEMQKNKLEIAFFQKYSCLLKKQKTKFPWLVSLLLSEQDLIELSKAALKSEPKYRWPSMGGCTIGYKARFLSEYSMFSRGVFALYKKLSIKQIVMIL